MATRLKPSRINVDNTPRVGEGASYKTDDDFHWSMGGGDMAYEDFVWTTLTGSTITIENISNNITPSSDFTVAAGTLKPGIVYTLRVNSGSTPYTMTIGTGITNPNGYDTTLKANAVTQFEFIATSNSQLELKGVDQAFVTVNTAQSISGKKTFTTEPALPNKTAAATNDGTKPATEKQVYDVAQELNNAVKLTGDQTVNGTKTFTTSPVVPSKTTDATNTGTAIATEAQVYKKANKVASATENNLASLTSAGDLADSGIAKGTVELNTNKETGDVPTDSTTKYPSSHTVKKYVDDQVAAATAGAVSDVAYGSSWDGVTGIAPSKNVVYDKISAMDTTIGNKANDSDVVKLTGNQTISGTKTFSTSPVVPSKTTDAGDNGTAIATEAQVYKKQDTLISGYTIKLVNNNSLLGSGNVFINDVKISSSAPTTPIEGSIWYDTTNDQLKVYDGTNWVEVGKEYTAGTGINIDANNAITNTGVLSVNGNTGAVTVTETEIVYATQTEYNNLPSSKLTDGKHYVIYSTSIAVTGVTLNESSISLTTAGDTYQLTATVSPNDATDKSVTWSSSDQSIATVSNTGLVTCVTPGTATITVTTTDGGFTATCGVDAGGWKPGVNTLAYYPLEEDLLDHKTSGTLYNLTAYSGNDYLFTTNSQGKACMMMNSNSSNGTYFRSNLTLDFANKDYTFCVQVCDHLNMYTTPACGLAFGSQFKGCPKMEDNAMGRPGWEFGGGWSSAGDTSLVSLKTSNFLCFITTWNHTTKSFTGYLNGVYRCGQNGASSLNSYSDSLYLGKDPYATTAGRSLHAKIRQVIIEEGIWDAEKILLYNDL